MGVFAWFLQSRFCKCIPVRRIYWVLGFLLYLRTVDPLVRWSLHFWHRHVGPASMRSTCQRRDKAVLRPVALAFPLPPDGRWAYISVPSPSLHTPTCGLAVLSCRSRNRPHFFTCWCIILHTTSIIERFGRKKNGCHAGLYFVSASVSN